MRPVLFAGDPQFWYETQRVLGRAAAAARLATARM
jgi:hypothetical protein